MLDVTGYRLTFAGDASAPLPTWLGSTWRGAMGHALKQIGCLCTSTPHLPKCVYSQIFETPVPADATRLRKYPSAPHPYILRPYPRSTNNPEQLVIDALLLGKARHLSQILLDALEAAALRGLGPTRACYSLKSTVDISQSLQHSVPDDSRQLRLTLLSPNLVKYKGKVMNPERFNLHGWLINLMRRSNSLRYFHGDGIEPGDAEVQNMISAIKQVTLLHQKLKWQHAARHSSRQNQQIDQSGLMGTLRIDLGQATKDILPLLLSGTYSHVGKSTVMGHGQYRVQASR